MIKKVQPTQVYHWNVTFQDGFILDQYTKFGGDRSIRSITDKEEAVKGGHFFKRYEVLHGRVIKLELLPFTKRKALICKLRNPFMHTVNDPKLKSVKIDLPEDCYISFFKSNLIDYNMQAKKPKATARVSSYTVTFHERLTKDIVKTFDITFAPQIKLG